jgi:hypothetical protein
MTACITSVETWVHNSVIAACKTGLSNWQAALGLFEFLWWHGNLEEAGVVWLVCGVWLAMGWLVRVWILVGAREVQSGSGAYSAPCSMGTGVHSWGLQWPGHEVNHTPPSSVKVKSEWSCTSSAPYVPIWCGQGKLCLFTLIWMSA